MAIEDFEKLAGRVEDPRRSYKLRDMPRDDADLLIAGLDQHILDADRG